MTETTPPKEKFSDEELASMRREVLHWLDAEKRRAAPRAAPAKPKGAAAAKGPAARTQTSAATRPSAFAKRKTPRIAAVTTRPETPAAVRATPLLRSAAPAHNANPVRWTKKPRAAEQPEEKVSRLVPDLHGHSERSRRHSAVAALWLAGAGSVTATLVMLVGIYGYGWTHPLIAKISRLLPLPAAYAGNEVLRLSDYLVETAALMKHENLPVNGPTTWAIRRKVIGDFAQRVALHRIARRLNIVLPPGESQRQLLALMREVGTPEKFRRELADNFPGWSTDDFRRRLLEPYLLRQAVQTQVLNDPSSWQRARQQASDVRDELVAGGITFADAAARYSRDESVTADGDLGFRGANDLPPSLFAAAIALGVNEISQPVLSTDGYHLLTVLAQMPGESRAQTRVHVQHILFPPSPSLDALLVQELQTIAVRQLVP